ncbi:MAG TPA: creatininase family protein [Thermomicrobiales bacterium]|nr:creatininase family protein [Thermomicrobiales bacterium]
MSTTTSDLVLANLSWPEVDAIRDQVEVVLLPVGSNEQHGPNLSLSMDIAASYEFCRRASEMAYPRLLVAPPMPWGVSFHHMNFPGTITLAPETFIQVLTEVISSLYDHGFERFLIVNGHGGNIPAMGVATVRIKEEIDPTFIGACSYFSFADKGLAEKHDKTGITGHACEMETSVAKALVPHVVKEDALAAGDLTDLTYEFRNTLQQYGVTVPYRFDEYTRNGALGDARRATLEYGSDIVESGLRNFVAFTEELVAWSPVEEDDFAFDEYDEEEE